MPFLDESDCEELSVHSIRINLQTAVSQFTSYFVAQTTINIFYLVIYLYYAFAEHTPCNFPIDKTSVKYNIQLSISVAYGAGLIFTASNFMICTFFEPCFRAFYM